MQMTNTGTDDNMSTTVEDDVIWVEQPASNPKGSSRAGGATPPPPHPKVTSLLRTVLEEGKNLMTAQIEIVKIKVKAAAKNIAIGAVFLVGAAVLALYLLGWTFHTIELAFQAFLAPWLASLITWGILLLLLIILLVVGLLLIKKGTDAVPETANEIKSDVAVLKEGLDR